ncbi:Proline-rich protein 23 [Cricetulus griseus]|uniref:Proline-rich protein 23 n=1 Tax=Cricetulus griseus TaxID=10029 RepID=G3GSV9_CRIGR|nr:Proline-rich protein 23 [Cricetulus griseus]
MQQKRPRSPSPEPSPCWATQPQGHSSAKRLRLHEPARNEAPMPPGMEAPTPAASEEHISVVVLFQLALEPQPTSVKQVELPGFTLNLGPENLPLSDLLGQPEISSTRPQEDTLLQKPQDQLVILPVEFIPEISYQEDACDEDQNSGLMTPRIGAPAGEASELFSSTKKMPSPWTPDYNLEPQLPVLSPNAARNIWELDCYMLGSFPTSPLQPLPSSPPPSPREQRPARPSRSPQDQCKPGGDCSMNGLPRTNPDAPQVKGFQKPLCVPFCSLQGCIRPDLRKEPDSRARDCTCSACTISTVCSAPCALSPCSFNNMQHKRPISLSPEQVPCWAPQPQGHSSAKRCRLHEPARNDPPMPTDMEALTPGEEHIFLVVLLHLVLKPQPTSVKQVELPGFTLNLGHEGLPLSDPLGQPEISSTRPQEAALLQTPQDQLVIPPAEFIPEISFLEDTCDEDQNSGFMTPWIGAPPGEASELFSNTNGMSSPWTPDYNLEPQLQVLSSNAARNIWELDCYLLGPFPTSPLQPLPPSPPPSPQGQRPAHPAGPSRSTRPARPPRVSCKVRRRLLYE